MKQKKTEAVLQDWVLELPFMQQALLLTAMRGPDGCKKITSAKNIVKFMRGAVLKPAHKLRGNEDPFMWILYDDFVFHSNVFWSDTDAYPMHFMMHLIHAAEVIGYKHSNEKIQAHWLSFYIKACKCLHMTSETQIEMDRRMNV